MTPPNDLHLLIDRERIAGRVAELGREITGHYAGEAVTVLVLLNGAVIFAADLLRHLDLPLRLDTMAVASYHGTASSGQVNFRSAPKLPVDGRRILLVDDILDTGTTLARVIERLYADGAAEVRSCVLLDKEVARAAGGTVRADWHGFRIPPVFVVGYGLDADEDFRHLPDICVCGSLD